MKAAHESRPTPADRPRASRRISPDLVGGLLGLINGVVAAIGGVYLSTQSVPATIIAGATALLLAALLICRK